MLLTVVECLQNHGELTEFYWESTRCNIPTHLGVLFLFDQTPVRLPLHDLVDGPFISNPGGQIRLQFEP